MNSTSYDQLIKQLILELGNEYPSMVRLQSIIEESNCPYLRDIIVEKVNSFKNRLPTKK